ncbi:MAG: dihydrolipoamide succinyltransferase, partial [Gammaproteobacteria bacterium]
MSIEVKVPQLPESVSDATLVSWHKQEGERVSRDENLVDLETDKVVLEVPAPADGVLQEIRIADGTTVTSGEVIAVLAEGEGGGEPESGGASDEDRAAGEKLEAADAPADEARQEAKEDTGEEEEEEPDESREAGASHKLS